MAADADGRSARELAARAKDGPPEGAGTDLTPSFTDCAKPVPSRTPSADGTVGVGKLRDGPRNA
ncbi:hypothetical protein [Streptomyces sp. ALI-76-A]|uniref:hypothetical protein n=1 Tax=Streptomyces sp. ALI-76-A TaxID=3025736 RepID=UPI00256EA303|nr:hypothetical protein [Streptomyces sp. ALI-76-A]MDL5203366.1 hypothetical protein [Streptomyces sp. ALI-76-A]